MNGGSAAGLPQSTWRAWLPLVIGIMLAFAILEYQRTHLLVRLGELAYGRDTSHFQPDGAATQCADASDSDKCLTSWRAAGSPANTVIWFGNSQLAAINRFQPGQINAPEIVRRALAARGYYLMSYSQPNANLTEEAIIWAAIGPVYRPRLVILPICYDDIRELGVRDTVADFLIRPGVMARLRASPYWPLIKKSVNDSLKQEAPAAADRYQSLQTRSEAALTSALEAHWPLWRKRSQLRGTLGFAIHAMRNQLLGIHSTSKRPVDAAVYEGRMALLDGMIAQMRAEGSDVLLYVPPYRYDIDGPYPMDQYRAFKGDLAALAARHGAGFADIDPIVPGREWATVTDDLFGFQEPDFMHFTASGHERLGAAIEAAARRMGY